MVIEDILNQQDLNSIKEKRGLEVARLEEIQKSHWKIALKVKGSEQLQATKYKSKKQQIILPE